MKEVLFMLGLTSSIVGILLSGPGFRMEYKGDGQGDESIISVTSPYSQCAIKYMMVV